MAAGSYSFTIEQGATTDVELVYKDSDSNPVDLTDYSAKMQLKNSVGGSTTYLTLSSSLQADGTGLNLSGSGGNPASKPRSSGSIRIYISHATSSTLTFGTAVYDLEIVAGVTVSKLLKGRFEVEAEVTKWEL